MSIPIRSHRSHSHPVSIGYVMRVMHGTKSQLLISPGPVIGSLQEEKPALVAVV
jgi:hypothetical protein